MKGLPPLCRQAYRWRMQQLGYIQIKDCIINLDKVAYVQKQPAIQTLGEGKSLASLCLAGIWLAGTDDRSSRRRLRAGLGEPGALGLPSLKRLGRPKPRAV